MQKIGNIGVIVAGTLVLVVVFVFANRGKVRDFVFEYQRRDLPKAVTYQAFLEGAIESGAETEEWKVTAPKEKEGIEAYEGGAQDSGQNTAGEEVVGRLEIAETGSQEDERTQAEELPGSINLAVPFTPQAPHANWELPYQEACEEASLLMVARYKNGKAIHSSEDADMEILQLVEFQNKYFGDYKDTTAEQTAELARVFYGFADTYVRYDVSVEAIKRELAAGNSVIVPAAGRELGNPYFRRPGPLYHMLVIRGYTEDKFITNDPGTRRGEEYVYDFDALINAVHDWNGGNVAEGQKVMIVVK